MPRGVKRKGPGRPKGSTGAQRDGSRGALSSLRTYLDRLRAERNRIDQQITALQTAMSSLGMPVGGGGGGGGRRTRSGSLKEFISRVLNKGGGPMAVKDVTAGVVAEGYQTRNRTLGKSVGIALTQMPEVAKVGRGMFKLK